MVGPFSRALKRSTIVAATGLTAATGLVALTSSPALAAPTWCGSWLQYPAQASKYAVVAGSEATIGYYQGRRHYMRVLAGLYGGEWYAFAKEYNAGVGDLMALIWVNRSNNGIYQCGNSAGAPAVAPGSWPSEAYTSGVDYSHAKKVQTKLTPAPTIYGPAVTFYWPG